ncbi:hypothetical protein J2X84_004781 [Pseudomonas corrugata]|nr:hypothetical protein [Pseudomonas corrugata]
MEIAFSLINERLNNRRFTVANNTKGLSGAGTILVLLPAATKADGSV